MLFSDVCFTRYEHNPIIAPKDFAAGAMATMNCGQTMYNGKTILLVSVLYRNRTKPAIHVAESEDGIHFTIRPEPFITRSKLPHVTPLDGWVIDPRVTYFAEDNCYYIMRPGNSPVGCVAILGKTTDFETYEDIDIIAMPNNRVPCLFPEKIDGYYVRFDRPYSLASSLSGGPWHGNIWLSYSPDLIHWGRHRLALTPWGNWSGTKIGPTPPIKTDKGWLEIIHGVTTDCSGSRYSLGAAMFDLKDPSKCIGKVGGPVLTPDAPYEYQGRTPNVLFSCGCIADYDKDRLRMYYSACDTSICLATGKLSELVDLCLQNDFAEEV